VGAQALETVKGKAGMDGRSSPSVGSSKRDGDVDLCISLHPWEPDRLASSRVGQCVVLCSVPKDERSSSRNSMRISRERSAEW
jgi:hypothetical protein